MPTFLSKGFFQRAYVTADLDHAIAAFSTTYGVRDFLQMRDIPFAGSTTKKVHIALAYAGETMIELIQPEGDISLYTCLLPEHGSVVRFHHCGHLLDSEADWNAMEAEIDRQRLPVAAQGDAGMLRYLYADTRPQFGHFLEFIHCGPEGLQFFAQVPRN